MSTQHLSANVGRMAAPTVSSKVTIKEAPAEVLKQTFDGEIDSEGFPSDASEAVKAYTPEQLPQREANDGKSIKSTPEQSAQPSGTKSPVAGTSVPKSEEQPAREAEAATSGRKGANEAQRSEQERSVAERGEVISAEPKGRDYTGFTDEEQSVLKKMSNNSFAFASKLIKENKELKSKGDGIYYQHQQAYTLNPEYQQVQTDSWFAEQEAKYWENQLYAMQEGQEWTPLIGYNQDGTFKLGEKRAPTPRDIEQVRRAMNDCVTAKNQLAGKAQMIVQQHQNRVQTDTNTINNEQAKRFAWVADPKQLENTVDIPGLGEKSIRSIREEFQSLFPSYHRNHIAVDVAANLFAALQIYGSRIRELEQTTKIAETKKEEVMRGEPKSSVKPSPKGKTINGVSLFDMDDFNP